MNAPMLANRGEHMKLTGIVRKVDELGRIVIPVELRRILHVDIGDALEVFTDQERVYLKKYSPACMFCDHSQQLTYLKGKMICQPCMNELIDLYQDNIQL
jgi:transcriptional pleiotropic regulator of transition state genes